MRVVWQVIHAHEKFAARCAVGNHAREPGILVAGGVNQMGRGIVFLEGAAHGVKGCVSQRAELLYKCGWSRAI